MTIQKIWSNQHIATSRAISTPPTAIDARNTATALVRPHLHSRTAAATAECERVRDMSVYSLVRDRPKRRTPSIDQKFG